ncbi:MAG: hypothetical protein S4CHLAM102_01620 [Chlamydiia bacterium]|nr:hypothetical protein [Chlamydiia bacterium]
MKHIFRLFIFFLFISPSFADTQEATDAVLTEQHSTVHAEDDMGPPKREPDGADEYRPPEEKPKMYKNKPATPIEPSAGEGNEEKPATRTSYAPPPTPSDDLAPQPPSTPFDKENFQGAFYRTFLTLLGIIVLVFLTIWIFRRAPMSRTRGLNYKKNIKVLERRQLSPKTMLYIIEVYGKQVILAESQLEVTRVTSIDWLPTTKDL